MSKILQWIGLVVVVVVGLCLLGFVIFRWVVPPPPPVPEFGYFEIDGKQADRLVQVFRPPGGGNYSGEENWEPSDWDAKLDHNLTFVDPLAMRWDVPAGQINNGASVPKILQSFVAGGHNGKFLGAAIVHDCFCQKKDARNKLGVDFPKVHQMFYYAMRASDVPESTAKVMYAAVCCFGPPGTPEQLIKALFAWNPEAGKRARDKYPEWAGWTDHKSIAASSEVAMLEARLNATQRNLDDVQARSDEVQRGFNMASDRMQQMQSIDGAMAKLEQLDDGDIEDLMRLADKAKELRDRSIGLEKARDASARELEAARDALEKARKDESRLDAAAEKFLASIQENHQSLTLDQIEAKAKETANTLPEAP